VDETAERILTLGSRPYSSYQEYIDNAEIREAMEVKDHIDMVEIVRNDLNILLKLERDTLNTANELGDEGTSSLMSDYITAKEKVVWMLSAYLR
jgi:starvation-inducible DNA-binding protein